MNDENKLDIELIKVIILDFFRSGLNKDTCLIYNKKTKDTKFKIATLAADIPDLYVSKPTNDNIDICIKDPTTHDDVKIIDINKHQTTLLNCDSIKNMDFYSFTIIHNLFWKIHHILFSDEDCLKTKESLIYNLNYGYEIFNPFDIVNIVEQSIEQDDVHVSIRYQITDKEYRFMIPDSIIRITYNNDNPYSNHEIVLNCLRGHFWQIAYDNIYVFRIYKNSFVIRTEGLPNELIKIYSVLKERKSNNDKERYKQTISDVTMYIDSLPINKRYLVCRGKTLKTGEWVYGFYHEDNEHNAIISSYDPNTKSIKDEMVYPETVSQCTGAKCFIDYADKSNDKMYIFEGDILRTYHCRTLMGVCMVRYSKDPANEIVYPGYECKTLYGGGYDDETLYSYCGDIAMDIIGNVYDNPEMLNEDYYTSRPDEFDRDKKII